MDTISRENNSSMLPVGAVIIGVLALLVGGYAAITASKVNKTLTDMQPKIEKIDTIETAANSANTAAERTRSEISRITNETNGALKTIGDYITSLGERVTKIEETAKKAPPPVAGGKKGGGEVVAGPNEYIVKAGDVSGAKIARDHGVSLPDLQSVNPGVNWNSLKIGQKLKLPVAKK